MIAKAVLLGLVLAGCASNRDEVVIKNAQDGAKAGQRAYDLIETEDAGSGARAFVKSTTCSCERILCAMKQPTVPGNAQCNCMPVPVGP